MRVPLRRPTWHEVRHAAALIAILATVAIVTYHPHWNPLSGRDYQYPVHMDEYVHWGYSIAIVDQGNVTFENPFTGGAAGEFTVEEHLHERGYHAFLGTFQGVTGVPWLPFFQYGPAVVAVFLALAVYVLCRRFDAGLEAALLVACIPTTLRFLGPGFMVPIAFSLPFIAIGLFLLFHGKGWGSLFAFFVIAAALWPLHVIGAFGMFALGLLYGVFLLASEPRRATVVLVLTSLPFLASWGFYSKLLDTGVLVLPGLPADESALLYFGILPLVAAVLGIAALLYRKKGVAFAAGGALGVGILLTEAVILSRLYYGVDPFILYDRAYMLLYIQCVIAGGIGLAEVRHVTGRLIERWTHRRVAPVALVGLLLASLFLAGSVVALSVKPQLEQPYYTILTDEDYASYVEAGLTLNATYGRAVVEGIPTMPFSILAGRPTIYVHFPSSPGADPAYLQDFFRRGANDTYLLVQNGVTIVVTDGPVTNPDLIPVGEGVYVLRWDYASRIAKGLEGP